MVTCKHKRQANEGNSDSRILRKIGIYGVTVELQSLLTSMPCESRNLPGIHDSEEEGRHCIHSHKYTLREKFLLSRRIIPSYIE